jgi:hypothetical protein
LQAILEQQALAGCVEMKVRPRYLVPDTNCFIDHLESLQQLNSFTLMVPLVGECCCDTQFYDFIACFTITLFVRFVLQHFSLT